MPAILAELIPVCRANSGKSSVASVPTVSPLAVPPSTGSPDIAKLPRGLKVHTHGRIEYIHPAYHGPDIILPDGYQVC